MDDELKSGIDLVPSVGIDPEGDELTTAERELIDALPRPPKSAKILVSNVWIVEWLSDEDRPTGRQLHDWMDQRRPGWSAFFSCKSKNDIISVIKNAAEKAQNSELKPVLHIESHGAENNHGLVGPDGNGGSELLTWDELTDPLQQLNLATCCNLVMVVAACTGFAGIQALRRGPRAPAVALVGPDATVMPRNLLDGTKEFYRRLMDENPRLTNIAESASQEAAPVNFEWESFAILFYEALMELLVKSMRPTERLRKIERLRQRMLRETTLSPSEIEARLELMPSISSWECWQQTWNEMFMIDIDPRNQERFGLDLKTIVDRIAATRFT